MVTKIVVNIIKLIGKTKNFLIKRILIGKVKKDLSSYPLLLVYKYTFKFLMSYLSETFLSNFIPNSNFSCF